MSEVVKELSAWVRDPQPPRFPYDSTVAEYRRLGKHFVSNAVLDGLAAARDALPAPTGLDADTLLRRFFDTALDKRDGRYDYPSYVGLSLLPIPTVATPDVDAAGALALRDRLVIQLLADVLAFELAAADGSPGQLVHLPPDARTVAKRCRLAVRIAVPALERAGLAARVAAVDPEQAARELCAAVAGTVTPLERRVLQLSMLPVFVSHDEYLFIRVLQLFETTFAMQSVQLQSAVLALAAGDGATAASHVRVAESTLRESAPLFSLLGTMQVEAFRTFRVFTDGASAIQSRNYKILESLCRTPDRDRFDSAAYTSTPEVRLRVLAGTATLDDAFMDACATDHIEPIERDEVASAMARFSETMQRWRQTHYRLAVRMIGERTGTGDTEGAAYLGAVRGLAVFRSIQRSPQGSTSHAT